MAQVFPRSATFVARLSIAMGVLLAAGAIGGLLWFAWSGQPRRVGVPITQPIPFSHQLHVAGFGIDCRYCHNTVDQQASAGMPATQTCMTCHSQIKTDSVNLAVLRQSWSSNTPVQWNKVYDLPDFVYFNHSAHIGKGVACVNCHGNMQQQAVIALQQPLFMSWCLDCHRAPERFITTPDRVYDPTWTPPADQATQGRALVEAYHIQVGRLDNCWICHR